MTQAIGPGWIVGLLAPYEESQHVLNISSFHTSSAIVKRRFPRPRNICRLLRHRNKDAGVKDLRSMSTNTLLLPIHNYLCQPPPSQPLVTSPEPSPVICHSLYHRRDVLKSDKVWSARAPSFVCMHSAPYVEDPSTLAQGLVPRPRPPP